MNFGEKIRDSIVSKAAEGLAISVSVIIIWSSSKIAPIVLPAIESSLNKSLLVSLLLASLALNIIFLVLFWIFIKKPDFKLKYGIYWDKDKNPHCPNCKIPVAGYNEYQAGWGYYCKPCGKVFALTDASGTDIKPQQAISEL
jgi:hypothetical protein